MADELEIQSVLDVLRPSIKMHGGNIEFIRYQDRVVYIRLTGACVGCPASMYTLKMGVEQAIQERVPDVQEVRNIDEEE